MGTTIRPELSGKNKYWIDRHRYYELKHFCLQYPMWKKIYTSLDGFSKNPTDLFILSNLRAYGNPTEKCAIAKEFYLDRMKMVETTAKMSDPDLSKYILKAVTEGYSYTYLKARLEIPCCKDTYYDRYRRFFWLLSQARK